MTNLATKSVVWGFWHDYSSESSDTTRPAKLRQSSQIKIQSGLKFPESVKTITQRGKPFYANMWRITHHPYTACTPKGQCFLFFFLSEHIMIFSYFLQLNVKFRFVKTFPGGNMLTFFR